jgi:AraC-like DNA-binding protein
MWEVCIIGLALTAFTLAHILTKPYKHESDWLLCIWLALLNIPLLHTVLSHLDLGSPGFRFYSNPTLNLLHGPILYLYVRMLISSEKLVLRMSELLHLIPFVVFYLLFISVPHSRPMIPSPNTPIGPFGENEVATLFDPLLIHFGLINGIFFIVYSIITIYALINHQKNIAGIFSQNDNQVSLKWLFALPITFAALVALNVVNENALDSNTIIYPLTFHMLCFLSFITLLCFFGVKQKPVFYSQRPLTEIEKIAEAPANKDSANESEICEADRNELSDEATTKVIEEMQAHMACEKPYLDPNFSVYTLAESLKIPRRTLSHVLNSRLSKNFYQYVNEFRIKEVKALLESPVYRQSTILELAFQSGFKSKSSFNSLFKKHNAVTPSQYRKMIRQQKD